MKVVISAAAAMIAAGSAFGAFATINGSGSASGNGNSGFGGVIGTGSIDVVTFADGTVNIALNRGLGTFNDLTAMYIDSVAGGFNSTASLSDAGDPGRAALSGNGTGGGISDLTFAPGFEADFGVAWEAGFSGLFDLQADPANFGFVDAVSADGTRTPGDATWNISFNVSQIGLNPGDSFDIVLTYLNAGNAFRSGEFIGADDTGPFPDGSNIGNNAYSLQDGDFITINTVPSPGAVALAGLAGIAGLRRRR